MKVKKCVKVGLIFIFIGGVVGGFYTFNSWFFSRYKGENKIIEKNDEQKNGKEIINNFENVSSEKSADILNENSKNEKSSSKDKEDKKKVSEIYYCSKGDTLKGEECITKSVTDAIPVQTKDTRDYYAIQFNFSTLSTAYGIEKSETISILQETCEKDIKGIFEINANDENQGSCIFTDMEEDKTFQYMCLDSSYTVEGTKCIKEVKIPAKVRYGCPDGFKQDGIYCIEE